MIDGVYVEDPLEAELVIKLDDHYPKPMMVSSLLLLQFNSFFNCYDIMAALKVPGFVCHENQLRFSMRDFRNKQTLMEMQD